MNVATSPLVIHFLQLNEFDKFVAVFVVTLQQLGNIDIDNLQQVCRVFGSTDQAHCMWVTWLQASIKDGLTIPFNLFL